MGRIEKLKRQAINEANIRVLNEQVESRPIQSNLENEQGYSRPDQNPGIDIVDDGYQHTDVSLLGGLIKFKGEIDTTLLKVINGLLFTLAAGWVANGVRVMLKLRDLKVIVKKTAHQLQLGLDEDIIKCLRSKLNNVGQIRSVDDEDNITKVEDVLTSCLWRREDLHGGDINGFVNKFYTALGKNIVEFGNANRKKRKQFRKNAKKGGMYDIIYDEIPQELPSLELTIPQPKDEMEDRGI